MAFQGQVNSLLWRKFAIVGALALFQTLASLELRRTGHDCQQKCRQSGREKMELRSVNYGWAIWWSIYICGCQSAPGSSRQQRAAATSVAKSVSYPPSVSSVFWLQTAYSRRQLTINEGKWMW